MVTLLLEHASPKSSSSVRRQWCSQRTFSHTASLGLSRWRRCRVEGCSQTTPWTTS